jgi:hypothetical protein
MYVRKTSLKDNLSYFMRATLMIAHPCSREEADAKAEIASELVAERLYSSVTNQSLDELNAELATMQQEYLHFKAECKDA